METATRQSFECRENRAIPLPIYLLLHTALFSVIQSNCRAEKWIMQRYVRNMFIENIDVTHVYCDISLPWIMQHYVRNMFIKNIDITHVYCDISLLCNEKILFQKKKMELWCVFPPCFDNACYTNHRDSIHDRMKQQKLKRVEFWWLYDLKVKVQCKSRFTLSCFEHGQFILASLLAASNRSSSTLTFGCRGGGRIITACATSQSLTLDNSSGKGC